MRRGGIAINELHWRSTGIDAMSARCECPLKERNFIMTTKVSQRPGSVAKCAGEL